MSAVPLDRSPESVERVVVALRAALRRHPDIRVGQMVEWATPSVDLFYTENDELAKALFAIADGEKR